jgi:hypothetical protein
MLPILSSRAARRSRGTSTEDQESVYSTTTSSALGRFGFCTGYE